MLSLKSGQGAGQKPRVRRARISNLICSSPGQRANVSTRVNVDLHFNKTSTFDESSLTCNYLFEGHRS